MKKKILIIGGGFVGSYCARKLEKNRNFDVTLIDTKDYFEFTPGILRTIVDLKHEKKITILHKDYLTKTKIILHEVIKFDDKFVYTQDEKLQFDYLIIASGSDYQSHIKEENIILPNRFKILKESHFKLQNAKNILIAGGGLVGVELASEITAHYKNKKLTLIHSHEKLIEKHSKKAGDYALDFLNKNGVKVIFNKVVNNAKNYDLTFFCTGIILNYKFLPKKIIDEKGIIVNNFLEIKGYKNIFAGGDAVNINEEKTAQNAENHAKIIVRNILRSETNKNLTQYKPKLRVIVISLGKYNGILEYKNFILTGKIPALLKWLIEKKTMLGIRYGR